MADPFETRLEALLAAEAPPEPDAADFLAGIEARVDVRQRVRRLLAWAAAAALALAAFVVAVAFGAGDATAALLTRASEHAAALGAGLPDGIGWTLIGLATLGLVFAGRRIVDEGLI